MIRRQGRLMMPFTRACRVLPRLIVGQDSSLIGALMLLREQEQSK